MPATDFKIGGMGTCLPWCRTAGRSSTPGQFSTRTLLLRSHAVCNSFSVWFLIVLLKYTRQFPAILKTFNSGAIESVLTQCISVWYGNVSNQDCKALQRVVRLAEHISGSALPSLQDIYLKPQKAELLKSSRTQLTPVTVSSFYCHLASTSGAWWQKLRDLGGASSPRPSGS